MGLGRRIRRAVRRVVRVAGRVTGIEAGTRVVRKIGEEVERGIRNPIVQGALLAGVGAFTGGAGLALAGGLGGMAVGSQIQGQKEAKKQVISQTIADREALAKTMATQQEEEDWDRQQALSSSQIGQTQERNRNVDTSSGLLNALGSSNEVEEKSSEDKLKKLLSRRV